MNKPLVSIITGYYNRKDNLLESVKSILNQDYDNFEVIVFDDCSSDGTRELLESFDDQKLRLIKHETNLGFTKGIIQAVASSKGNYIAIHGAGDISYLNRISKQVEFLELNPAVGIVGCLREEVHDNQCRIVNPVADNGQFYFSHGEVMFRKDLYYQAGGYNALFEYGQFTMLKLELIKLSKAACIDEVLYRRFHFFNGVTRNRVKRIKQKASYTIGKNISRYGLLCVDTSRIVVATIMEEIELLERDSEDERFLLWHLRWHRMPLGFILYKCFRLSILPGKVLTWYGKLMRKRYKII